MHNLDRGMIKWQPFNSVVSSKEMIKSILIEKNKISKPNLSEEQKGFIEQQIIDAYYCQSKISLAYFYHDNIYYLTDYIKKIDFTFHKIYFNKQTLVFDQIIKVLNNS